ncbi:hypothetical protein SAMN04487906_1881 [Zhouia amylolytica]|uniref:Uncharacterized protein n=1 Tax=Zhouia amylolytica TaxID=376730 RepID=A0A1I6T6I1_9FLAO|nr:hypothetical protein [Zhouia amylolytica]SFS84753.1 hypothetical protein SAMN04487906_1881 [Zhouia amylolytica]
MTPIEQIVKIILEFPANTLNFWWGIINPIIIENWYIIAIIAIIMLNIAVLKFIITGKWGALGSVLYNIFYIGIIYLIIYFFGPEIILKKYFNSISFLVYVCGFFLTRLILQMINIKNLPSFHYK